MPAQYLSMKLMPLYRIHCFFFTALLLTSHHTFAQQTQFPMALHPAPGISAHIKKQGNEYVLIQPNGQHITIASPDNQEPVFSEEDDNFDGYPDLSVALPVSMVNFETSLYLYVPVSKTYRVVEMPKKIVQQQNCKGLGNIDLLPEQKAIHSECRSGPAWSYDILQIESDGSIWLSGQSHDAEVGKVWPHFYKPKLAVQYHRDGTVLSERVLPYSEGGDEDADWKVPVKHLPLYSAPDNTAKTRAYLIQGDQTTMLAFRGNDWMRIAWHGKRGTIKRWISLKDAYGKTD